MTEEGKLRLIVALDEKVVSEIRSFSVDLDADAKLDGDVKLGWTEAELMTALAADVAAKG